MPGNSLSLVGTAEGVVSKSVAWSLAGRTGTRAGVNRHPKPQLQCHSVFRGPQVETKGGAWDDIQPGSSMRKAYKGKSCQLSLTSSSSQCFLQLAGQDIVNFKTELFLAEAFQGYHGAFFTPPIR